MTPPRGLDRRPRPIEVELPEVAALAWLLTVNVTAAFAARELLEERDRSPYYLAVWAGSEILLLFFLALAWALPAVALVRAPRASAWREALRLAVITSFPVIIGLTGVRLRSAAFLAQLSDASPGLLSPGHALDASVVGLAGLLAFVVRRHLGSRSDADP